VIKPSLAKTAGVLGATVGVAAVGAIASLATHRYVARQAQAEDPYANEAFGTLRGAPVPVTADDGVTLHVEVDEPEQWPDGARLTVVLCHGFALNLDEWYFQRKDLADVARIVSWDMRSHGRSTRAPRESLSFERVARDLVCILDAVVPDGPIVLVGHSMGGMAVLTLADLHPELFGDRIVGVGLVASSAGDLRKVAIGVPGPVGRLVHRVAPGVLALLARQADVVERGRKAGTDLAFLITRRYAFGTRVPASLVQFCSDMIEATPVDVVAAFTPMFATYDSHNSLKPLQDIPVVVVGGGRDMMTPVDHSRAIAQLLPRAKYVELPDSGHMVLLEHPDVVGSALLDLVERSARFVAAREGK
jgi:pimeloyl-ACP methyl ester carboxylesterase